MPGDLVRFSSDFEWLSANVSKLLQKFRGQYVLVRDGDVVLANKDFDKLLEDALKQDIDPAFAVIEKITDQNVMVLM